MESERPLLFSSFFFFKSWHFFLNTPRQITASWPTTILLLTPLTSSCKKGSTNRWRGTVLEKMWIFHCQKFVWIMDTIYYVLCPDHQFSSSSNWILMSCQPYRVTPGQSNSGHKQIHISKLFSHIYQPSASSVVIKILQWVSGQCTNNNKKRPTTLHKCTLHKSTYHKELLCPLKTCHYPGNPRHWPNPCHWSTGELKHVDTRKNDNHQAIPKWVWSNCKICCILFPVSAKYFVVTSD